jgi:outer membrane receptor protein involved in Fe transport
MPTPTRSTEDDKYKGKRPTQVPENAFNLWGDYTFENTPLKGLMLGAGARYTGPMEISPANDAGKLGAPRSTIWRHPTGWVKSCLRWQG